jgi:tetratricopeptide (TPR) repeat protein
MTQSVPYAPWVSLLRDYFGLRRGEPAADACRKIQEKVATLDARLHDSWHTLCRLLSIPVPEQPHATLPENEAKRLTFETVGDLFRGIAEQAPLILIIEDLHWMDTPSREMLDLAVSQMGDDVEMVLVTHRPEHQPFWRTRATFTQINLLPLSGDETREIVRAVAGGSLPPELERGILAKAEGNPFFTEEITRALIEEGYLLRSDGRIRVTRPPSEMRLPGTVEEVIGARLDRLGPQAKRTVQVAAVLGRQFHRVQLEALVDAEEIDVAAALTTLEAHGIIHRKAVLAGDEFRFGESLTQTIAYESLLLRQRRELHARVGGLLENGDGDPTPERSALIAHHFALSDDRTKAVAMLLRAAEDAERIAAFPTATGFYRQAWELASEMLAVDDSDAIARQTLLAALGVARAVALYGAANPEQDVLEIAARGRELATRLDDDDALSRVLMIWGMMLTSFGRERYDEGIRLIEEAHGIAIRLDDPLAAVRTARALAWGAMFDGRFAEANQRMAEVVAELERHDPSGGSDVYVTALFIRDRIRLHGDDLVEAEAARATFEHARAKNNRTVQAGSATTMAMIHLLRAEYELARDYAERSLAIGESTGNLAQVRPVAAMAVLARHELGEPMVARHVELLRQGPVVGAEPLLAPLVVEAFLALEEPATAKRYARSAIDSSGGRLREAAVLLAHAEALRGLGAGHCAQIDDLYTRAADLAATLGARSIGAAAALGRGQLALARGERAAALRALEDARVRFAALGFQRYVTRAECLIGELSPAVQETA